MKRIVGILLVRNEDLFVAQAIRNAAAFCDELLLCDHRSTDGTTGILREFASRLPHASFCELDHPRGSHDLLKPFAGTPTWVFGFDGDELYDPNGLAALRPRLLGREFDAVWRMKGNVIHCLELDRQKGRAIGHLAPPSRSITKLYNFSAIEAWSGDTVERLHGGAIRFQPGWNDAMKRNLQDEIGWEDSSLRCLHLCFLRRSSRESDQPGARENIMEIYGSGLAGKLRHLATSLAGRRTDSRWKREHYCRGEAVAVDTAAFFASQ